MNEVVWGVVLKYFAYIIFEVFLRLHAVLNEVVWGGAEIWPHCKLSFSNNGETCAPRKCNACCRSKDYREGIGGWVGGKGEFLSG